MRQRRRKPILITLGGVNRVRCQELRDAGFAVMRSYHRTVDGIVIGRNWQAALTHENVRRLDGLPAKSVDGWLQDDPPHVAFNDLKRLKSELKD